MRGGTSQGDMTGLGLPLAALDRLMPFHLWLGDDGRIRHVGPTLAKLWPGPDAVAGMTLFDLFAVRRPAQLTPMGGLSQFDGASLKLVPKAHPDLAFFGTVSALTGSAGVLVNLSPGVTLRKLIQRFHLTLSDFAATDLTAEMLFLIEANTAAVAESRRLNACLEGAKKLAEEEALTDTLTGLRNRRAMDQALRREADHPAPDGFGVMHVDLDFFKSVNDTLGHAAGDHVLTEAARILREETRRDDLVARVGGDEFVVLLRDCSDLDRLEAVAARIIARLEEPIAYGGEKCRISASIGVTLSSQYDELLPDRLLSDADAATYAAKKAGRGKVAVHAPPCAVAATG